MEPKFLIFYSLILLERKVYSALTIEECPAGMINITENDTISLTCGEYDSQIEWYYSSDNTLMNYIGFCSGTSCYPTQRNQFRIDAERFSWSLWSPWSYKSTLGITRVTREEARFFYCKDSDMIDTCRLRVTVPAKVVHQNCSVWISNWQVQGECLIERMYASDNVYKCTWGVSNDQLTGVFQEPLTPYQEGSRIYMRGVCSFRQEMPFNSYSYTYKMSYTYRISVDPGPKNSYVTTINLVPPSKPEVNCLETVLEGSTVICMCSSKNTGNPPAKFGWDGLNTDKLLLRNVRRQKSSTNYTCRQTWDPYGVINTTVNYNLKVAYGPSDIDISIVISENGTETLICTAIDVFPSAMFHWNISCDKTTDTMNTSTCTLHALDADGEIVVLCTANNKAFPDSSVTKNFRVDYARTKTEISSSEQSIRKEAEQNIYSKDSSSSGTINGGLIGGVVAAVIFAIIIGAVIVVIIVKRRKEELNSERFTARLWPCAFKCFHKKSSLSTPYATVNKPKSATPIQRLAAPSGDLYTRATNNISVDVSGDYVTVSDTTENTVDGMDRDCPFMASQSIHETTELKESVNPTINPKPTTGRTKTLQDTTGSVYMNVTEVPTDSGLGVYHIVPWRTMSAPETDTRNSAAVVADDEYNALSFEEDRSGQEDQAATYNHLEHE